MTVKAWSAKARARCSIRASTRAVRPGPKSVSASSGVGSFIWTKTGQPSSLGTAAANTRKSGIVFTCTAVYGRRAWRAVRVAAARAKNHP